MSKIEIKSLKEILLDSVNELQTEEERLKKVIDLYCHQTKLIDLIVNNLPAEIQEKIYKAAGFKEMTF